MRLPGDVNTDVLKISAVRLVVLTGSVGGSVGVHVTLRILPLTRATKNLWAVQSITLSRTSCARRARRDDKKKTLEAQVIAAYENNTDRGTGRVIPTYALELGVGAQVVKPNPTVVTRVRNHDDVLVDP